MSRDVESQVGMACLHTAKDKPGIELRLPAVDHPGNSSVACLATSRLQRHVAANTDVLCPFSSCGICSYGPDLP